MWFIQFLDSQIYDPKNTAHVELKQTAEEAAAAAQAKVAQKTNPMGQGNKELKRENERIKQQVTELQSALKKAESEKKILEDEITKLKSLPQ
eukprot:m.63457 g.63457  ORF g.63457 m.63457 type:complete len:92 (-) comp11582_c0_seq1:231-506(-)